MITNQIILQDCISGLKELPENSIDCCVTSPPYFGLRDYGTDEQIGLEETPEEFVNKLVEVFTEVNRVLKPQGTLWLNLGDSYNAVNLEGLKPKDLIGIPWMVAFALRSSGWYLRQDIIWNKPNPMPESVTDRCTKSHEYIFLLSKSNKYYYDYEAIKTPLSEGSLSRISQDIENQKGSDRVPGKANGNMKAVETETANKKSVWTVTTKPFKDAHFATYPEKLIVDCIKAGCPPEGKRCDCDEIINTPTGTKTQEDPSKRIGGAGIKRPRNENEGTRPITKREQRWEAKEIKKSIYKKEIKEICGSAFEHYIRTDLNGASPLPEKIRNILIKKGWITSAPPCNCPVNPAGIVLDPFMGAGTTAVVAKKLNRNYIGFELNPEYKAIAEKRLFNEIGLFI